MRDVIAIFVLLILVVGCRNAAQESTRTDSTAPITRVISTAPNLTEIVFELGAGERLVGVTRYCNHPEAAKAIVRIGGYLDPSVEKMVALKPQLVLSTARGGASTLTTALARYNIPVLQLPLDTLDDVKKSFITIGKALALEPQAQSLTERFNAEIRRQQARIPQNASKARALIIIGHKPLIVAGRGAFIGDLILLAGGENVAADSTQPYPQWSAETLLRRKPEVIIDAWMGGPKAKESPSRDRWRTMQDIPAVKNGRVHQWTDDRLLRPGPRLTDALERLVSLLHPGAQP
jgi:iron complex transport system substrate-binding protein